MPENIVFSKKEILNQFTTEELILELVTRDGNYLKNFFEAFIGSSILLRTHTKFSECVLQVVSLINCNFKFPTFIHCKF